MVVGEFNKLVFAKWLVQCLAHGKCYVSICHYITIITPMMRRWGKKHGNSQEKFRASEQWSKLL